MINSLIYSLFATSLVKNCHTLPAFNALTGGDKTSYRFTVGTVVRIFNILHKDPKKCKYIKTLETRHL